MVWLKRILMGVIALVLIAVIGIVATGNVPTARLVLAFIFNAPELPFDPADAVPPPDYTLEENWAALPTRQDLADMAPPGVAPLPAPGSAPVDVFYIHPTGFLKGSSWTFSMDPKTSTEENTGWMMANQASTYNGCCNVYAPRYRQASIFTYFSRDETIRDTVLAFAYQDVERAFDYFLEHYNDGRPFIIASHSQGTHHGTRLLQERIEGTELAERLIAAYILGGGIEKSEFAQLQDIALCDSPTQLHCAVHWDTFSIATLEDNEATDNICTNPLTWKLGGGLAAKELHRGAVRVSGEYHVELSGDDAHRGVKFEALGPPLPQYVEAQCVGGRLYITDQSETPFGEKGSMGGTYHGLDYPMFYMDIRENVNLRVATYLAQVAAAAVVPGAAVSAAPAAAGTAGADSIPSPDPAPLGAQPQ